MEWSVTEQGPRVVIEVQCDNNRDGLYKAFAVGQKGSVLLGTLVPEKGKLALRRTLSVDSLKRQGAWPVIQVESRLAHSFSGNNVSIPWVDEILRSSARRLSRYAVQRSGEDLILSTPFDTNMPFPLVPLFCLSRVESGRVIFSFRKDGTPYIFQGDGKNRKEIKREGGTPPWQI